MNMFWKRSKSFADVLVKEYPNERQTIERLRGVLEKATPGRSAYNLDRLSELVQPQSENELALILAHLVSKRVLRLVYRVESPENGGGIADFARLEDIPSRIHDKRTDTELEVTSRNLKVLYEVEKSGL